MTVNYATANVTATAPADYTAVTSPLTLRPGPTQQVTVVNVGHLEEANETFQVNLTSPTNATIADNLGIGTIVDNDPPTISIGNTTVTEGNTGTINAASRSRSLSLMRCRSVSITLP